MSWTKESYLAKAQAYWVRASENGRENGDFLLNVCFTVEFTSRAVLCQVNPALNSAFDTDSLLFACGLAPANGRPKTIDFSEALKRLKRLIPELTDAAEMTKIRALMDARNGELHDSETPFEALPADKFIPNVYSYLIKISKFANIDLVTVLGKDDADIAIRTANALTHDRTKRVKDLIDVFKGRFYSLEKEEQTVKRAAVATKLVLMVLTSGVHIKYEKCPSCASLGQLLATPAGHSSPFIKNDELVQEVRVTPFQFACKCCGLEIPGLDELMSAGFNHEYRSFDAVDPIEHFNIDPLEYIDQEQVAREYYSNSQEYNDE